MNNLGKYRKSIAALVTGLIGWAGVVIVSPEAAVMASEWLALGVVLATSAGVYQIPNDK